MDYELCVVDYGLWVMSYGLLICSIAEHGDMLVHNIQV